MSARSGPIPALLSAATAIGKPWRSLRRRSSAADRPPRPLRAPAAAAERPPGGDRGHPVQRRAGVGVAGHGIAPGEHRRPHRLVVIGPARSPPAGLPQQPAHEAHAEALERRDRQVAVEIVAVRRIDVRSHPQPRIGDAAAWPGRTQSAMRAKAGRRLGGLDQLLDLQRGRLDLRSPRRQPRFHQGMVVVAHGHHHLPSLHGACRGPRRTAGRPPSPRAAGRGAARGRPRAAPSGRPRRPSPAARRGAPGGAAGRPRRCSPGAGRR